MESRLKELAGLAEKRMITTSRVKNCSRRTGVARSANNRFKRANRIFKAELTAIILIVRNAYES